MALSKSKKAIFKAKYGTELYGLLVAAEDVIVTESDSSEVSLADKLAALIQSISGKATSTDITTAINNALGTIPAGATATTVYGYIAEAIAAITIPSKVSDLTNDSGYQTAQNVTDAINAKIASTYKAGGSVAFADLPALSAANEGKVVNITDTNGFTTTADFVEGAGKKHPVGTNVVIINTGTTEAPIYKYDVLAGFVDLSGYAKSTDLHSHDNKTTLDAITDAKVAAWDAAGHVYVGATQPSELKSGDIWLQTFEE